MTLCDKYKPKCFADVKGQDLAIDRIKKFIEDFQKNKIKTKKAIALHGPAGAGKTCLAYALASETKSEILELNASDLRNSQQIENIIGQASQQSSLFAKQKILLIDEIDGITRNDRGGLPELIRLINETKFPIIITANNIWDRKFNEIRKKAELVEVKELDYRIIFAILREINEKENFNLLDNILTSIAIKAKGDVRAAINDLQTAHPETTHEHLHERDKEESIFNVLKKVFKDLPNYETLRLYDKLNMPLNEIFLWIEENTPLEYQGEELFKAFEAISKADVFRGRIHRQQYWRFLVYQNFLLSAGISSAKRKTKTGFTMYKKPTRILKIWLINQKHKHKKTIAIKYAKYVHIGTKRAMREFPIIKQILKNPQAQQELKLNEEEIQFLEK